MTDDEAATLLGIAYSALRELPVPMRVRLRWVMEALCGEVACLRINRTPEDIQNEFEGRAGSENANA